MDCCDDRSASRRSTAFFLLFVVISLLASSPLARSRQTMTTVAPICASASAVAFPMPELAPVTMQIFPCILLFTVGMIRSFHNPDGPRHYGYWRGPCIAGLAAHARDAHPVEGGRVESLGEKPDRQDEFEQASGHEPDQSQASHRVNDA